MSKFFPVDIPGIVSESIGQIAEASRITADSFSTIVATIIREFPNGGDPGEVRKRVNDLVRQSISAPVGFEVGSIIASGQIPNPSSADSPNNRTRGCSAHRVEAGDWLFTFLNGEILDSDLGELVVLATLNGGGEFGSISWNGTGTGFEIFTLDPVGNLAEKAFSFAAISLI